LAEESIEIEVSKRKKVSGLKWLIIKEQITGYLFVFPAFIIIFLFGLFPIGYSVYMSLFNWNVVKGKFVGADNYLKIFGDWRSLIMVVIAIGLIILGFWIWRKAFRKLNNGEIIAKIVSLVVILIGVLLFTTAWRLMTQGGTLIKAGFLAKEGAGPLFSKGNEDFLKSLIVTLYYALGTVPAEIITGMVIAYILFQGIKGKEIFRMIFFLPYVTPAVSTAVVFQIIFSNRPTNIANTALSWLGMDPLKWRFEPKAVTTLLGMNLEGFWAGPSLALVTIILFGIWTFIGYNTVIFLAGLGNVPKEIYEAAEMDGATSVDKFRYITMPLLSPVTFYLTLVAFIGTFKAFNHLYVMRTPSAGDSVITTSLLIWDRFYRANQYSTATSQAIVLFLVILGLTFAQNKLLGERVFYG
jgi:multiple sugar transport system permease protein